jgi:hypothetical protein
VDNPCTLRCQHSLVECPGTALRFTDGEEGTQAKQMIRCLDDLIQA